MSYKKGIIAAIMEINDRSGSSSIAIKKQMLVDFPAGKKWNHTLFLNALKKAVSDGDVVQVKRSYKLSTDYKKKLTATAKLSKSKKSTKQIKPKATGPPYEWPKPNGLNRDPCWNHKVLYNIRAIIGNMSSNSSLYSLMNNMRGILSTADSTLLNGIDIEDATRSYFDMFFTADRLEQVFGNLDTNPRHPGGWDDLGFGYSSTGGGVVGVDYESVGCKCCKCLGDD